jgi:hypothetical protein
MLFQKLKGIDQNELNLPGHLITLSMNCSGRIQCHDKRGHAYEIGKCSLDDFSCLMGMYDIFSPKPASQGLPPPQIETCRKWAQSLLEIATNLLAWQESKVIGHAALIKDVKGSSGEFVIFVHQDFRNRHRN